MLPPLFGGPWTRVLAVLPYTRTRFNMYVTSRSQGGSGAWDLFWEQRGRAVSWWTGDPGGTYPMPENGQYQFQSLRCPPKEL